MIKIAYIYPALTTIGGADRVITEKANYFAEKLGYEVYIITAHQNGRPLSFQISPKVNHIDLDVNFLEQYKYSFFKRGYIYLKLIRLYKNRLSKTLNALKVDFTLTTISRDVDFLTDLTDGSVKIAEAHVSKKFIRNIHQLEEKGWLYKMAGKYWTWKLEKSILRFAELVVLTEKDAKNWSSIRASTIIPNSLPFYPEVNSSCLNKKIISVGRLDEQKGYDMLLDAWELVSKNHPGWTLSIFGEGNLLLPLRSQIEKKNLTASFVINKPVKNIEEKYIESSFYVMSSRFEGFGMVLIEAMACGLPVISFDCPNGPSDIIRNYEDGILVENGNIADLADKIAFLIENEDKRINMGLKARMNVMRYAPDEVMNLWKILFEKYLEPV